ncbi:MAG: heme A synthase [Actinobacteria bacterium]|nr:MAG: heme A synthase [Actinomycetota bacterium]TML85882.1 MAG: heme A synthase [Actinomycetota bacterium]
MHAQPTALARLRALALSPAQIYPLVLVQLGALWLIVGTGAAVRLTDSGLGCRHWPGCEAGHPLPAKNAHAFVEFGNRLVGGVTIAVALLAWLAVRRVPGLPRFVRRVALAIFLGTLAQAPIGLLAIATDLRWPIVMVHLLLSIALLAGATILVLEIRAAVVGRIDPLVPPELRRLGLAFAAAGFVLIVSGSLATASGPHSGGGAANKIGRLGRLAPFVYAHAMIVGIFLLTFLFSLGYLAARRDRAPRLFKLGAAVFVLLLVQMGLGELQWRTHLPWGLVLAHVFLAATVWVGTVALATLFFRPNVDFADR